MNGQAQRRAGMEVPRLRRIDAMPVRALAARQQEIDRGRGSAAVDRRRIAERLAEMPALRMRREGEHADDVGGGGE